MTKRYFGKTTPENAKQPTWTDGEKHKTAIHWKQWAENNGYISELFDKKFQIINPRTSKIIKILKRT